VVGKSIRQGGVEEAPEKNKESSHFAHANRIECMKINIVSLKPSYTLCGFINT
jgi:hypothetical protein